MAYGRLDVFWPDGLFKTFALVDNTISVGRSTGNTIALETTTISRYHFSIAHNGEQVLLTDLESVNGTFVDGEKLKANEPRPLYGGEEIQVGHLRMIYHHIDELPTQPMAAVDDTTQRIELQLPAFRLDVIGPDQPFSPGAHMSAELSITNTSEQAQRYRVEVTGLPPDWIRIDRPEISIEPTDMAQVLVNFKPLRRPDSKPGDYRVTVKVSTKDNPDSKLEAVLLVRILPYAGFGMALDAPRLASGDRFKLHIHNQGSAPLPLNISGRDKADKLRYTIITPQVSLAPGQRMTVTGEVKPKSPALWGKPRQHPFDLLVRSNDAAHYVASARGYFTEKPMLPSWTPLALAGGAVVILALLALAALVLFQPAKTPVIAVFQVNSTQVAQGQPIVLNWAATDVSEYRLELNGTPVLSQMNKDTPGVNLDTKDLSGNVVLSLLAVNGGQQANADQSVFVYRPLGEIVFTSEPAQLVRYVVQNLTVTWSVPGAVSSHLSGLESFSNTPTDASYGADGTISGIVGIPSEPVKLVLSAQDEVGNTQEKSLEIPVINPECMPASKIVTLYAGPDPRHQVVSTVQPGAIVVVDAQDSTGGWLRVQLPGGLFGWGAVAEFTCAQNFKVSDLYKELAVPTVPPPTLPPTLTPTPTATATRPLAPTVTPRATASG
ncbi:MAG: FHA domain-containing protein [Chloroflexota bacterium]